MVQNIFKGHFALGNHPVEAIWGPQAWDSCNVHKHGQDGSGEEAGKGQEKAETWRLFYLTLIFWVVFVYLFTSCVVCIDLSTIVFENMILYMEIESG